MDRNVLVSNQVTENCKLILDYNVHYKTFERIVQKNCPILKQDNILSPLLPIRLQFLLKKSPSLCDCLATWVIETPIQAESRLFKIFKGFYVCGWCTTCKHLRVNIKKLKDFTVSFAKKQYKINWSLHIFHTGSCLYAVVGLWSPVYRQDI